MAGKKKSSEGEGVRVRFPSRARYAILRQAVEYAVACCEYKGAEVWTWWGGHDPKKRRQMIHDQIITPLKQIEHILSAAMHGEKVRRDVAKKLKGGVK